MKLQALPVKLWAKAMYGISGCPVSDGHLHQLRLSAARALGPLKSGASAVLRLSLATPADADPGMYQLWTVLHTFRRMCFKQPSVLPAWRAFMHSYDGTTFQGPFSKLLTTINQVGWELLDPPTFRDHEGLSHSLLEVPASLLRRLAERAWLNFVAVSHRHRQTMLDLDSLDACVLRHDAGCLSALDAARRAALQSGTFMFESAHARFDLTKSGLRPHCQLPDTREHRVCYCPRFAAARAPHQATCDRWSTLPVCLTHHLLVPANPHSRELRSLLHALPAAEECVFSTETVLGRQHLFTDGSGLYNNVEDLAVAAWAVVHSGTGRVLAGGPLPGLLQSVPRAELTAVLMSLRWSIAVDKPVAMWSDAKGIVQGVQALQCQTFVWSKCQNRDLWRQVADCLAQVQPDWVLIKHVPSHLDPSRCTGPVDDWICQWNGFADRAAGIFNQNRDAAFVQVHSRAKAYFEDSLQVVRSLRSVYFAIGDLDQSRGAGRQGIQLEDEITSADLIPVKTERPFQLSDRLPIGWRGVVSKERLKFPISFTCKVMQFLLSQDEKSSQACSVSWVELTVMFVLDGGVDFPVDGSRGQRWGDNSGVPFGRRPTRAVQLRIFRQVASWVLQKFGLENLMVFGLSLVPLGIAMPCDGVCVGCSSELLSQARLRLRDFVAARLIKSVAGFARPLV